eukprot:PITA_04562
MPDFGNNHEGVCKGCAEGKHTRDLSPQVSQRHLRYCNWQLVHSDLSGMLPVTSLGGCSYYMTVTDDFSRKTWIYFLKKKDEAFMWFRTFKALVENMTGKKIKILRTDNGTEYESNEFKDFCREAGIKRETTTTYTPEQNGVAERKNRTIVEATRAMLCDQGLPKFLWGKAANTVVYIQNRCPHFALDSKTPEERSKLDATGKKGMFVGYSETSKAYRVYVPGQREVEISHDVTFDEDASLKKVVDLPRSEENHEERPGNLEEPQDETMPDVEGPMDPIDPSPSLGKRPSWLRDTLEDVEGHAAPRGTFRESKKPCRYQGYLAAMSTIVQSEPGSFEEAIKHQVWKDAMHGLGRN